MTTTDTAPDTAMPAEIAELVERLRERAESYRMGGPSSEHTAALLDEAATALTTERSALAEALKALEPFAKEFEERREAYIRRHPRHPAAGAANFDKMPDNWPMEHSTFSMGVYRAARRALTGGQEDG